MAGNPLFPYSSKPKTSGRVFPIFGGSGGDTEGLGVEASLAADSIWKLRFQIPTTLPTGTLKLVLELMSANISGNTKVNPKWVAVNPSGVDLDASVVVAEGVSTIVIPGTTWQVAQTKIILNASTAPTAGQKIIMDLTFETSLWTLASVSTWLAYLIWE